jgi:hypothetical protein
VPCVSWMGARVCVFTRFLSRRTDLSFCCYTISASTCLRASFGRSWRLGIHVQGVMQLRSGRRDQNAARDDPLTRHFIVSVARRAEAQQLRSLTELCGLRVSVESYVAPKAPLQCKRCLRFGHTQRNCGYPPRCVVCGEARLSGEFSPPQAAA